MNESTDRKLVLPVGDSRLNEFIRRAGPIITAERGLNERSRMKLRSLASTLKMPNELYDLAIEYFQQSGIEPKDKLTRFERDYWNWLDLQFRELKQNILSTELEQACLERGTDKHQLSVERARQLIHDVAREHGMQRVGLKEAENFLNNLVIEQIGSATVLDAELRKRLHRTAAAWGVEEEVVDAAIDNRLVENGQAQHRPGTPKRTIALGICAIAIGLALYLFSLYQRNQIGEPEVVDSDPIAVGSDPEDDNSTAAEQLSTLHPKWSNASAEKMLAARRHNSFVEKYWNIWTSQKPDSRIALSKNLLDDTLQVYPAVGAEEFIELQALLIEVETDERTRNLLVGNLNKPLTISYSQLPDDVREISRSFVASEIVYRVWQLVDKPSPASSTISQAIVAHTGLDPTDWQLDAAPPGDYVSQAVQSLARQWLDAFVNLTPGNPEKAASLILPFKKLVADKLEPSRIESRINESLLLILESRPELIEGKMELAEHLMDTGNSERISRWSELLWTSRDDDFREWLSMEIAERLDVGTNLETSLRIEAIRNRLASANAAPLMGRRRVFAAWLDSNQRLREIIQSQEFSESGLQTIADVSVWCTQALALYNDQNDVFQSYLEEGPPGLFETAAAQAAALSTIQFGHVTKPAHATHRQSLDEGISVLADGTSSRDAKLNAFRRLLSVADRFDDLDRERARIVCEFLANAESDDEIVAIRQDLSKLGHWKNLHLQLVYLIESTDIAADNALTLCNSLAGQRFQIDESNQWRSELLWQYLSTISNGLKNTVFAHGEDSSLLWDHLKRHLEQETRNRLGILGQSAAYRESYTELNQRLVAALGSSVDLDRDWMQIDQIAVNSLHRAILVGRSLVHQAANDIKSANPQIDNKVALILDWHDRQAARLESYEDQLLLNEITLLKIWTAACQAN